jgi:hypothetical protein
MHLYGPDPKQGPHACVPGDAMGVARNAELAETWSFSRLSADVGGAF